MTLNELKCQIAEILEEAKKKRDKAEKVKRTSAQVEAYGFYSEELDFSQPLGAWNHYARQGAANWGPMTAVGTRVDQYGPGNPNSDPAARYMKEGDAKALRATIREVIENGLVDEQSAWAPLIKKSEPIFESSWEEAEYRLNEAWYDDFRKEKKSSKSSGEGGQYDKTSYGHVKPHGQEKKKGKKSSRR